ncbi:related to myo-inositol transport protein ITR1 [Cephalotrichum gorgonifer]|uniref:Related to myo-inositol transport protein ITR1 n=1 Tax=Cephalotrichum gorgonifer TaxID=2041049 RepID=A0AAE8MZD0_9PEZI|nr:related to myo-inositol transport protein ITR1 [Cephalotrichum gorgonifer]
MESDKTDNIIGTSRPVASSRLENPLAGLVPEQLQEHADVFCAKHAISDEEDVRAFRLGAQMAGTEGAWESVPGLTDEERSVLKTEKESKWTNPRMLYLVVVICSLCATVQGMDETVVNGAQAFYKHQFGIAGDSLRDTWLLGLTNGAPYLCCATIGCWLTYPLNKRFGRRGTIFVCEVVMVLACIWQAFPNSWWHLFIARCALGLGLGPVSATIPMFAAETAPPRLRGALVMQWQMWTAFGIMVGYAVDLALYQVPDVAGIIGLRWRLMLASAALPAVLCAVLVWIIPESPRWYLSKGQHVDAYRNMCRLRFKRVQAARDIFYADTLLAAEHTLARKGTVKELFTVRRNRHAFLASEIVMFMQQFCGINVVAYYSTEIFLGANFSETSALCASLGFGVINFLFALPAFWTIDTFGRRNLLLTTFPLMSTFLLWAGFSFWIPTGALRIAMIISGLYLFGMVYSPGEGPVPFTYSAEAYPLYIRPIGMSFATATTWFFNFLLAVTWPSLQASMTPAGAFGWYAGWNVAGFFLVLFFLPETKELTLEELDAVFDVPLSDLVTYGKEQLVWFIHSRILRRDVDKPKVPRSNIVEDDVSRETQEVYSSSTSSGPRVV